MAGRNNSRRTNTTLFDIFIIFPDGVALWVDPIAISGLKPHLSALAVDNHGMTAVGGGTFLAYSYLT